MTPQRLELSSAKGFNLQAASHALNGLPCIKVDRTTMWGNLWAVGPTRGYSVPLPQSPWWLHLELHIEGVMTAQDAVACFAAMLNWDPIEDRFLPTSLFSRTPSKAVLEIADRGLLLRSRLPDLRGKNLACCCKPGCACHADVLLEMAGAQ